MLTLYTKTGCPYSLVVQKKINELGIDVLEKNIADETCLKELMEKGGVNKTPFFVDDSCGLGIYDSDAIVEYLNKKFGSNPSAPENTGKRDDMGSNMCPQP